jgi:hypothetical protein
MFSYLPVFGPVEATPATPPPTLDDVRARIALLDPALEQGSPSHEAALILVTAASIGQNIDRISRFTALPRELVARCARRLVDNGVWHEGNTVCRWLDTSGESESFRGDVAVAEGRLCRRITDEGEMEWAPQGYWRKHYDYVRPRDEESSQVVCYHPHVEPIFQDIPYSPDDEEVEEEDEVAAPRPIPRRVAETVPSSEEPVSNPVWLGGDPGEESAPESWSPEAVTPADDFFPDAVWLG